MFVKGRPAHFFNGRSGHADIGEQPVIKPEKLPVLVSSIPPQHYSDQPCRRNFPGPPKIRKSGGCCVESGDWVAGCAAARHVSPPSWSETTLGSGADRAVVDDPSDYHIMPGSGAQANVNS
jgi:hypothetical protein